MLQIAAEAALLFRVVLALASVSVDTSAAVDVQGSLMRKFGLSEDNVVDAIVVNADGN